MYTDFHTHILPGIDDGSSSPEESIEMFKEAKNQNVTTIVATPHFYPLKSSVENFLVKREWALDSFQKELAACGLSEKAPKLLCGAEFYYIKKLSIYPDLEKLCLEGTSYLLLEMPYSDWHDDIFEEIYLMIKKRGIFPIIAHPDRFLHQICEHNALEKFAELDCLLQINIGSLSRILNRKRNLKLLSGAVPYVLGTDMHSVDSFVQKMPQIHSVIERNFGKEAFNNVCKISAAVLENQSPEQIKAML